MILRKGITGFQSRRTSQLSRVDYTLFCHVAYDFGRLNGANVVAVQADDAGCNFYHAVFDGTSKGYLFCNAVYPILAWSTDAITLGSLHQFIDIPNKEILCSRYPLFDFPQAEELHTKVPEDERQQLSLFEREQAQYWNAQTFGDFIFNRWD